MDPPQFPPAEKLLSVCGSKYDRERSVKCWRGQKLFTGQSFLGTGGHIGSFLPPLFPSFFNLQLRLGLRSRLRHPTVVLIGRYPRVSGERVFQAVDLLWLSQILNSLTTGSIHEAKPRNFSATWDDLRYLRHLAGPASLWQMWQKTFRCPTAFKTGSWRPGRVGCSRLLRAVDSQILCIGKGEDGTTSPGNLCECLTTLKTHLRSAPSAEPRERPSSHSRTSLPEELFS